MQDSSGVPIQTPAAPATSAAAIPPPVAIPPAATTGRSVRVEHLLQQRQGGPLPGVPAGLGALGDDHVDAGVERPLDVGGRVDLRPRRRSRRRAAAPRTARGRRRTPRPGSGCAATVASNSSGRSVEHPDHQPDAERRPPPSAGIGACSVTNSARWLAADADHPEPAARGDRAGQLPAGHPGHRGPDDRRRRGRTSGSAASGSRRHRAAFPTASRATLVGALQPAAELGTARTSDRVRHAGSTARDVVRPGLGCPRRARPRRWRRGRPRWTPGPRPRRRRRDRPAGCGGR